jgi:outer membrane protein TolC
VKTRTNSRRASTSIAVGLALAFATALLSVPLHAQISLRTVVELAQEKSNTVRLAQADVKKSEAALEQTLDAYIPNFSIGSTVGYSHGFPTGQPSVGNASMQSLVLSYPQRQYIKAAHAGIDAAKLALKDAREQVALEASTAYIELDTVNSELAAARQQKTYADNLVSISIQRASVGVDSSLDLLQSRLRLAQIKLAANHLETRAATLTKQLSGLTDLPVASILTDRASIPEIPAVTADQTPRSLPGVQSATQVALSKQLQARGDDLAWRRPLIGFGAVYNYDSNALNNYSTYYQHFTPNNVSFGLQITVPFFDFALRAKAKVSAAEALRAKVEAEQAEHQNDVQIATLTSSLKELAAQAEIASLKQQIADAQLKSVLTQLEFGNGAGSGPGAPQQLSPKAEQLARIDERQKLQDALDSGFDLSKVRLTLLKSLGHMDDWINQLQTK